MHWQHAIAWINIRAFNIKVATQTVRSKLYTCLRSCFTKSASKGDIMHISLPLYCSREPYSHSLLQQKRSDFGFCINASDWIIPKYLNFGTFMLIKLPKIYNLLDW